MGTEGIRSGTFWPDVGTRPRTLLVGGGGGGGGGAFGFSLDICHLLYFWGLFGGDGRGICTSSLITLLGGGGGGGGGGGFGCSLLI